MFWGPLFLGDQKYQDRSPCPQSQIRDTESHGKVEVITGTYCEYISSALSDNICHYRGIEEIQYFDTRCQSGLHKGDLWIGTLFLCQTTSQVSFCPRPIVETYETAICPKLSRLLLVPYAKQVFARRFRDETHDWRPFFLYEYYRQPIVWDHLDLRGWYAFRFSRGKTIRAIKHDQ